MTRPYTILEASPEEQLLTIKFAEDVIEGLTSEPKKLPCKYIYDDRGSSLFSRIMDLDVYYLTDCETEIFETCKESICEMVWREGLNIVELGAGDGKKTRILLEYMIERDLGFNYVPIDISESAVSELTRNLGRAMPDMDTHGLVAEYMSGINWLSCNKEECRNLVLFLGSSIGNFSPAEARQFLHSLRGAMGPDDYLLIGFDLVKNIRIMQDAYDDPEGITALFNLNLLERINNELGGEFDTDRFDFHSVWDPEDGAIQSYLISSREQDVRIHYLDSTVGFRKEELIHTESSYKFAPGAVAELAADSGFEVIDNFYDSRGYFLDIILKPI
jgi:dimethylhistidine N-methyltransferase